jgi:hypothetical protein
MLGPLEDENYLRQVLEIPDNKEIVAITPVGYPAIIPQPRPRRDPDLIQKVIWLE